MLDLFISTYIIFVKQDTLNGSLVAKEPKSMAVSSPEVIRHILIGLGYLAPEIDPKPDLTKFAPWKRNNNSLTDDATEEAIKKFQKQYPQKLVVNGNADVETRNVMEETVIALQNRLKFHGFATNAEIPKNLPFYGPATYTAVKKFQKSQGLTENGIATIEQRQILQQPTLTNKPQSQPQIKLIDLLAQFKKNPQNPSYIAALNNLQQNLPKDVLHKVTNKWRGTNDQNPEIVKLTNVFIFYDDNNQNHRDALTHLQSQITPAISQAFLSLWNKK
ncbi:peptidoglycan-binding protein [Nostoc sphaeroides CHAB 2801]|uniref:peptidoglycan-binding domain-containing protein n=1 Tax=Nostoc sphaeroides TaxID=446679 RepID=UPI000E4DA4E3|nr:peptidoglycan-binding domain-containing protein [Nostoc sphaeroides]MCC5627624.1 peptidoglycan-binding protein [Nostoc sphaeroides CHAB 2801]